MLKTFASVVIVFSSFVLVPPDCTDGCTQQLSNTTNNAGLAVTLPTIISGSCDPCLDCGECIPSPCKFDGVFRVKNDQGVLGDPFHFKINGSVGFRELRPGAEIEAVYHNQSIDCGDGWSVTEISLGGAVVSGEIHARCRACPLK